MDIGSLLPIWSVGPFIGMLLSIAIIPLARGDWWERHQLLVALFWSAVFLVPFATVYGLHVAADQVVEIVIGDYVPFIALLLGLFVIAGGIHVRGTIVGTTRNNVLFLLLGSLLASWIGTTGAAMLLIRPILRANQWRRFKVHIVVFFIFAVANMGGCLTPLGDPPLFLGYLRGVPFFWTMQHIWPILLVNLVLLLVLFVLIDRRLVRKEGREGRERLALESRADNRVPIRIEGWHNFIFLALIIAGVILNGLIPQIDCFVNDATGLTYGLSISGVHVGIEYVVQLGLIAVAALLSWMTTGRELRERNSFEWAPMAEVAKLFIGIFVTMIPAIALLRTYGGSLGINTPASFFWATGMLSSFLDNSPTYVVFLTTAGALGNSAANAITTAVGSIDPSVLLAISAGAVFMGAMTYIGNAPNFMVKSIAERSGIKMPSFFGYMGWSICCLMPIFIIDTLLFFL